jgi:hypothetical protein
VSEELDELIEMARTIRMTPEQGDPMSRKARDMGHPRRSFADGNVKIENDSISWELIDRAAERFEKRSEQCSLSGLAGLRRLNLFLAWFGTTEVMLFHEPSRARAPARRHKH